jgi:hypothetical protein
MVFAARVFERGWLFGFVLIVVRLEAGTTGRTEQRDAANPAIASHSYSCVLEY